MRRFFVLSYSLRNMTAADIKCESTSDLSLDTLACHSRLDRESPYKASISSLVRPNVSAMISIETPLLFCNFEYKATCTF